METKKNFYRKIFEDSPVGMSIYDANGQCVDANTAICDIIGATKEQILTQNFHTLESWQRSGLKEKAIEAINKNTATHKKVTLTSAFGKEMTAAANFLPFSDEGEHFLLFTLNDLSDIKEAGEDRKQLYQTFFENNFSPILVVDPNTSNIVNANTSACRFYGYTKETITKMKITDINVLSADEVIDEMDRVKSSKRNFFNFRHRLSNGSIRDVEVYSGPITVNGVTLLCSIIHDISEQKKADLEWTAALDASKDALYLLDVNRRILRANKVFYLMTSSTPQTAIGEHIEKIVHPQGEAVPCPVCRAQEELRDSIIVMEPDNPDNPAGRPIEITVTVVKDTEGTPVSIFMRLHDLTEQRKTEDKLRKSKEEWEKTFNAINDIITIQDKDMRIIKANKAAFAAFPDLGEGIIGKYCYEIFRGENKPCANCPEPLTIQSSSIQSANITHKKLGKIFHVTSAPIMNEEGEFTQLVHIATNITDQKKMEEELLQAHKMEAIGTLAGGIAHDFNNILAAIIGYADMARNDIPEWSHSREYIEEVLKAGNRAKDLVRQILTFSRKGSETLRPLLPSFIIKEGLKLMRASLPTTIEIREEIAPDCGSILADPTNIHQILVNLCTNALHAMKNEKGVLTVKLSRVKLRETNVTMDGGLLVGTFVELAVSDTGCGMDEATLERIFEPYFTTKEIGKGSGMGLALVHGIVQRCGGFIRVESEPGKGSTFHVYLPAIEEETEATAEETQKQLPLGDERILVVDDEPGIAGLYQAILEKLGYNVAVQCSSQKALEMFRASPGSFDLIVTDQTMPHLSGSELAGKILQIRPNIPVILCTGYSSMISEEKVQTIGIKKFLMKPVSIIDLAIAVREELDKIKSEGL